MVDDAVREVADLLGMTIGTVDRWIGAVDHRVDICVVTWVGVTDVTAPVTDGHMLDNRICQPVLLAPWLVRQHMAVGIKWRASQISSAMNVGVMEGVSERCV